MNKLRYRQLRNVRRLRATDVSAFRIGFLNECHEARCRRSRCSAACAYANRRYAVDAAKKFRRLVRRADGPVFEVYIGLRVWNRPKGDLHKISLEAARKQIRRSLDKLYNPEIVAVGTLKATSEVNGDDVWRLDAHLLIVGPEKEDLRCAFETRSYKEGKSFVIDPLKLQSGIRRFFQHQPEYWRHPRNGIRQPKLPESSKQEYLKWLLPQPVGALTIRYGCDTHFNRLKKTPRTMKAKPPSKKRRDPVWLARYQFGSEAREASDLAKAQRAQQRNFGRS